MQQREILVMGIINVNQESFYEGSRCTAEDFYRRLSKAFEEGADIVDIGACSTRPGSTPLSPEEEWANLAAVLGKVNDYFRRSGTPREVSFKGRLLPRISIDTFRSLIVKRSYELIGPFIVNDISFGEADPHIFSTVAELKLPYIAMHMRGTPQTMQQLCNYPQGVTKEVTNYFIERCTLAERAGIEQIIIDPGFGFAKSVEQNYQLVRDLGKIKEAVGAALGKEESNVALLAALSRKSMLWRPLGITPNEALPATVAMHLQCLLNGADMIRVHDIPEGVQCRTLFHLLKKE